MEQLVDKSDGRVAYYSNILMDGFGIIAEKHKHGEGFLIQYYSIDRIKKDKRKGIIRIYHHPELTGKKPIKDVHPPIEFVIDLKNHKRNIPFHLNLSNLSKKVVCQVCRNYFFPLNHFDIVSKIGVGTGSPYKIIDWNKTVDNFLEELKNNRFFKEFPIVFKHQIG